MPPPDRAPSGSLRHHGRPNRPNANRPNLPPRTSPRQKRASSTDTLAGDAHWRRVMETKEAQWRLLNALALHELATQERTACAEIDTLSRQLESLTQQTAKLQQTVRRCRAQRQREMYENVAKNGVGRLCLELEGVSDVHREVCDVVRDEVRAVVGDRGLVRELERFCEAATKFGEGVKEVGVGGVEGLEELAKVVGGVGEVVGCAAQAVGGGGRNKVAREVVRIREGVGLV